ncbi:beta-lactamase/transpeptidase-like protein [Mycena metata]|uniref:Beta-lactamase/transpeptidase-like protein n=1 Tax=Mycena metata TaxID=1033252 RepID=A0AAD7HS04_9AGAR|nr:beta-lactamase/transpeptidase-like protein [Mycena metata]
MSTFKTNADLHAYLTQLILPPHLRGNGGEITQAILSAYNTPGISIAILPPSSSTEEYAKKSILTSTFGLRDCTDEGSAVDAATIFQACSISKPFTALAVLRLVVQGRLNLDTDIEEYLALDKNRAVARDTLHLSAIVNPATAPRTPITLRLLLSHKSGLSTVSALAGYYGKLAAVPPIASTINGIAPANNPPIRAFILPGLGTSYSGGGTTVVQHILTLVTGKPFPALMHELVLEPLGMTRSTYEQPIDGGQADRGVNYAKAHLTAYVGYAGGTECLTHPEMAAAGLWTTPSDLLKGLRAVFDCLAGAEGAFLPPALVAESFTETNGFGGFGIGWQSATLATDESHGKRRVHIGHGGMNQGFTCSLHLVGDIPLPGRQPPVSDAKPPCGISWMSNIDDNIQLGARILTAVGWLVDEPLGLISVSVPRHHFFPVLAITPEDREKVAKQIEGWQAWIGDWQMKDGGDVALYGPRVTLAIGESSGLPTMSISVLSNAEKPLVLLPAALHHPEAIVWVVRDMNVSVAMKKKKSEGSSPVLSLEIWQNRTEYEAEKI